MNSRHIVGGAASPGSWSASPMASINKESLPDFQFDSFLVHAVGTTLTTAFPSANDRKSTGDPLDRFSLVDGSSVGKNAATTDGRISEPMTMGDVPVSLTFPFMTRPCHHPPGCL